MSSLPSTPIVMPIRIGHSQLDENGQIMEDVHLQERSNLEFIRQRELGMIRPNKRTLEQRSQYPMIAPNQTIYNIPVEFHFPKRFTPCGKYLICFDQEMESVQIHDVRFNNRPGKEASMHDFLLKLYTIKLPMITDELISRDFCMFVPGRPWVIIASTTAYRPSFQYYMNETNRNNIHSLPIYKSLHTYTFWLIDCARGTILDNVRFDSDSIQLYQHNAVSICGTRFAVTSIQHQIVNLYNISEKGKFVRQCPIGPNFYSDDPKWDEGLLIGFRQRLVAFLYGEALASAKTEKEGARALVEFHAGLERINKLRIAKAQFFDAEHMIIKVRPLQSIMQESSKTDDDNSEEHMIFWNIPSGRIIGFVNYTQLTTMYDNCREHDYIFRNYGNFSDEDDEFLNTGGLSFGSNTSNSIYHRLLLDRLCEKKASCSDMSLARAKRMIASVLPFNSQQLANPSCPFFDSDLFIFPERHISPSDHLRTGFDGRVRFRSRRNGQLRSTMSTCPAAELTVSERQLHHWVIHPFLPLFISVQVGSQVNVINIHYHSS